MEIPALAIYSCNVPKRCYMSRQIHRNRVLQITPEDIDQSSKDSLQGERPIAHTHTKYVKILFSTQDEVFIPLISICLNRCSVYKEQGKILWQSSLKLFGALLFNNSMLKNLFVSSITSSIVQLEILLNNWVITFCSVVGEVGGMLFSRSED